jgi:hypothetical protein
MARNCGQGIAGHSSSATPPSFFAASLIRSRQRSAALLVLRSSVKAVESMPSVNSSIKAMFSKMSSKRRIGSLEGAHGLGLDGSPHAWLERSFLNQIYWLSEQLAELNLDACHTQKRYAAGLIESS